MRYLLIRPLAPVVAARQQQLIEQVAGQFDVHAVLRDGLPPHLTLKYWFEADAAQLDEFHATVRAFIADRSPPGYRLGGIDTFPGTVFVDVEPSPEMRVFQGELVHALRQLPWMTWGPFDGPDLHFHATLASRLTPEQTREIAAGLQGQVPSSDGHLDTLALLGRSTPTEAVDGDVRVVARYPLSR